MCLIAVTLSWQLVVVIMQVALGLGAVIFVHELGHFAVAKMCGVKCDKFFIGFDVGGYKISRKWGETEYGIGILPLGGYVKMLGQDDNPANIAEQMRESEVSGEAGVATKEITGPDGEKYVVDKRSYLAKSVPQRMAIISAGVIMNVIFAVVFATIAYGLGVPVIPSIVSHVAPGSAAYQADIRPGDEIVAIGETQNPSFSQLMQSVTLGDLENGIEFQVKRAATSETETINLKPRQGSGRLAKVGIASPSTLRLIEKKPTRAGSAASTADFQGGDEIIAVDGEPVNDYREWLAQLVTNVDAPLEVTVRRGGKAPKDDIFGRREGGETITFEVPAQRKHRLGLAMEMGIIVAVQENSPAAAKGLQPGDFIDKLSYADSSPSDPAIEGDEFEDPITLPQKLQDLAAENRSVLLSVRRSTSGSDGQQANEEIEVPLRVATWNEPPGSQDDPLSAPALGVAYRVLNRVRSVVPESPAAQAGLQVGDVITEAKLKYADPDREQPQPLEFKEDGKQNWPLFTEILQGLPADTEVELSYRRGDETASVTLMPALAEDQYSASRGFRFEQVKRIKIADSFGEQVALGFEETKSSLGMVFRFLRKIGTQIPVSALGGPITIAKAAGYSAYEGVGKLLLFLTMLSANLAVINFLPIPLLDGGHMVFLAWEGIRGRPASEKLVVALHTVGFVCIISLMVYVIGLDLEIIPRNL
ncbi:MAG: site-2 protease family protein [Planctomycetota bacterium]